MERVVLDTNILLQIIPSKSNFHYIWNKILDGEIIVCISTEILLEYEEILSQRIPRDIVLQILYNLENHPKTVKVTNYVRWNVVEADADDNKYVDCAVAAGAKILVSDDKHLRILKKKVPPLVDLKTLQEYHEYLNSKKLSGIGGKRKNTKRRKSKK